MTPKQQRFVDEYLIDTNATKAYQKAYGGSEKAARVHGARLVANGSIAPIIQAAKDKRAKRTGVTQDYVIGNLTEVVERCMQRAPVMEFDKETKSYIQSQDGDGNDIWTFDPRYTVSPLTLLGKHLGMFGDKLSIDVNSIPKMSNEELEQTRQKLKLVA